MEEAQPTGKILRKPTVLALWICLFAFGMGVILFRSFLSVDTIHLTMDDGIGALSAGKQVLPQGFLSWWDDSRWAGAGRDILPSFTMLLFWLLPLPVFVNYLHLIMLGLGALWFGLFLQRRGCRLPAILLGMLTAYWLGCNFTLSYAGHIGKFGLLMAASLFLLLVDVGAKRGDWRWLVLAGGALGMMFVEQGDEALFFSLILGPYAVYALWRDAPRRSWKVVAIRLLPIGCVAFVIAAHALLGGYRTVFQAGATPDFEDEQTQFDFATQWSWPPEESLDFIAPGYTGWRTGEITGPYWGRMGRTAGWEYTREGYANFKYENVYLGAIPFLFALLAWATAVFAKKGREQNMFFLSETGEGSHWKGDIYFWVAMAVLSLLLAFGKFFPLYEVLFQLPVIRSIRNPNKFLQVFQLAMGILSAYGFTLALRKADSMAIQTENTKLNRWIPWCQYFFLGALGMAVWLAQFGARLLKGSGQEAAQWFSQGWGELAPVIVSNKVVAVWHGAAMALMGAMALWALLRNESRPARWRTRGVAWALVILVVADAVWLSKPYLRSLAPSFLEETCVVKTLKENQGFQRVSLASPEPFVNIWLTYTFPYHGIHLFDFSQGRLLPSDYARLLGVLDSVPERLGQLCAVGYVLAPTSVLPALNDLPSVKNGYEVIHDYHVTELSDREEIRVTPGTKENPGKYAVLRFTGTAPRYALLKGWVAASDEEVLANLANPRYPLWNTVMLAPEDAEQIPASTGFGLAGTVKVKEYAPGRVVLGVDAPAPSVLRISERYDPFWKVTIDGKRSNVMRVDFMFQGVFVEPGVHEVVLNYSRSAYSLGVYFVGVLICLGAALTLLLSRTRGVHPSARGA